MATKIIIETEVDTGNSAKDLKAMETGIDAVVDSTKGLTSVEARFDALNKKIEGGEMSIRDMTKAVKEYQTIAIQAGQDSPIGQAAILKAAELSDELGDLQTKVKNLGNDGRNMQAALQLGGVVVSGYTAFQSVLAMVGNENEDLLKIITKLQAAQGALAAIEQVRASLEKESFLMLKLKNIQLEIQEKGYKKLFVELLKNPYVAIGAAILGVIGFMSTLINKETEYERTVRMSKQAVEDLIVSLDRKTKLAIQSYDHSIAMLQAEGKETFEMEKRKQELIIATSAVKLRALKVQRDAERQANNEEIKDLEELGGLGEGYLIMRQQKEKDTNGEIFKSRQELNKKIEDSEFELQAAKNTLEVLDTKHRKDEQDKKEKNYQDYLDKKKKADDDYVKSVMDGIEKIRIAEAERADAEKRESEYQAEIDAQAKQNEEKLKQDQEFHVKTIALELEAQEELNAAKEEARKKQIEKTIEIEEMAFNAVTSLQTSIFELTNYYGKQDEKSKLERAKRQFKVQKATAIAQAGIDGAKAVTKGIAEFGPPPSPLGIAAIASAGIITAAQIAAIATRQFDSSGMVPNVTTGTSFNSSGDGANRFINQQTQGPGNGNNQPNPVMPIPVLETELVTNTQNRLKQIETLSRI